MPASVTSRGGYASGPVSEKTWGVGSSRLWPAHLLYATDATGGPHRSDPRGRIVAWAVTIHEWRQGVHECVGGVTGILPPGSTVAQGEAYAIARVCHHLTEVADVTTDCQAAARQQFATTKSWPWAQARGREHLASLRAGACGLHRDRLHHDHLHFRRRPCPARCAKASVSWEQDAGCSVASIRESGRAQERAQGLTKKGDK